MTTDELIDRLVADLRPVPRYAIGRRLLAGFGWGAVLSAVTMWAWLGTRPDLGTAVSTGSFWMKFAYTLALALTALWSVSRLARPGGSAPGAFITGLLVIAALGLVGLVQVMGTPEAERAALVFGSTSTVCPWRIVVLSAPILVGALWAMRRLAPTDLVKGGVAAGLASGATGAWIYSFACDENAAPFVAIWYTAGILAAGLVGLLAGRRVLRW